MSRLLGLLGILAFAFFASPLAAQQDTTGAGQAADTGAMTTREGTEGGGAGAAPGAETEMGGDMGTETDTGGGEMPTTASDLPLVAFAGAAAIAIGLALRYVRRRS
jgi:hypothetical protein